MRKVFARLRESILPPQLKLEERIFNLLCFVGVFSLLGASLIRGLWFGHNLYTTFFLMLCGLLLSLCVVLLNHFKLHRSVINLALMTILNALFPVVFFTSGGVNSGMTAYFVLSLALIFMFTSGRACFFMVCWHICMALGCYYLSYTHPELVMPLRPGIYVHLDCILAIALSGLLPALLVKAQTEAYVEEKLKAQTAAKARSDFLANMSHEIRTPLNAIIGVSEIEMRSAEDEDTRESLRGVYNAGVSLLGIINDILDISKMESGYYEIFPETYDFASLVLDTVGHNMGRLRGRPIEFRLSVAPDIPRSMFGDEAAIRQIMNNLLSNAFKYTNEGAVELKISAKPTPDKKYVWLHIVVSDSGRGIKAEDLDKIFSDYNKLDRQATAVQGIGLGLPICEKLASLMGGTVTVESEYGLGSSFTVIIPQLCVDPTPIGPDAAERLSATPGKMYAGLRPEAPAKFAGNALLVDDVELNLEIAKSLLEEYGLRVDTASRGKQAVDLVKSGERRYDIIFMDHMMPEMNGEEAVLAIRELGSAYAREVPIIGLTARERGEGGNETFFQVTQDLVTKPVDARRLEKVLEKWLKK